MPKLLTTPFAADAPSDLRTDIQVSDGAAVNSATYQMGFPEDTMKPITAGGVPPKGSDFNGIFYDITDNIVFQTQGNGYPFDADYATSIGGYPLNARLQLDNGDIVRSTVANNTANPNSDMTGWSNFEEEQKKINNTRYVEVSSIAELISLSPISGIIYNVESFWADKGKGKGKFIWSPTSNKSTHDGGYVIDPTKTAPTYATIADWFTPNTSGTGVFKRLSDGDGSVWSEQYGAIDDASMTNNHICHQNALYKAASYSTPRTVRIDGGVYRQTGEIIISTYPNYGNTIRVPAFVGQGRGKTEIWKVANSTLPNGVYRSAHTDIDCIVLMAGRVDNASENIIDARLEGIQFMRTGVAAGTGFGVYAYKAIYYDHRNINAVQCNQAWYQNDCWMGQINNIKADNYGSQAFSILGGTSVTGRNIYAANGQGSAFDLSNLTYSDLGIHADGGGRGDVNGASAIKATGASSLRLLATVESHRGTEFDFSACEGVSIVALSYNTSAVQDGVVPKVKVANSNVSFEASNWQRSLNQLSTTEAAKYKLFTKDSNSNLKFLQTRMSPSFTDYPQYVSDFKFIGDIVFQNYSEVNRTIKSNVSITANTFKKLCYLGDANRFIIKNGITTATNQDRVYTFPTIGHVKSAISTSSASPTNLSEHIYINGVVDSTDGGVTESQRYQLKGYMGTDGWLYVATTTTGNNLEFTFEIVK